MGNKSITFYSHLIDSLFAESFTENEKNKIINYRNDYLKIHFLRILENQKVVYEVLNNLFKSQSYEEILSVNHKDDYRESLKNLFNDIVLNDEKGMTLADIYVEPSFRVHEYCLNNSENDSEGENNYSHQGSSGFIKINNFSIHDFIYTHLNTELPDSYKCKSPNLFFILGYPGQGKSSFCKKFLFDTYSDNKSISKDVHFIKFRNITNTVDLINNPIQTLYEYWRKEYEFEKIDKLNFKNSVLVLDGLDELFMKENLSNNSIDEFCRVLARELESEKLLKVIITSRYGYVGLNKLKNSDVLILQLEEFDLEKQIQWLNSYRKFYPEGALTTEKLKKYNSDDSFQPIKELITQPILLHMIATLNQEVTAEMNRANIYSDLFDKLIERKWAAEGQIDILKGLEKEDLRGFLQDIAFIIFNSGREYIHKSKLIELPQTQKFIEKLESKDRIQDVVKNIMVAFYFQETKKKNGDFSSDDKAEFAIEFLHKSLQEYLVAEKIWEELLEFINKDTRKGKYKIDDAKFALQHLTSLIGEEKLSMEIIMALKEIIKIKHCEEINSISDRIRKYLPEWFKSGFVLKYEWGNEESFRNKEDLIFSNIWSLLRALNETHDYLGEIEDLSFFSYKNFVLSLNNQVFNDKNGDRGYISNFSIAIIPDTLADFTEKVEFQKYFIFDSHFEGTFEANFIKARISGCSFHAETIKVLEGNIDNTDFYGPYYNIQNTELEFCRFFDVKSIELINCSISNCDFFIVEDCDTEIFKKNEMINCNIYLIQKVEENGKTTENYKFITNEIMK